MDDEPVDAGRVKAPAATWLAFVTALALALRQPPNPVHVALGAVAGALLIGAGFAAASRCRPSVTRPPALRARLAATALLAGCGLGAVLLASLIVLARFQPAIRARFVGRLAEPLWRPWALAFESSVLEEVVFRLFVMSVVGWLAGRALARPRPAVAVALGVSALLFGAAHLPAWSGAGASGVAVVCVVLALNGAGGLLFGWVFWRWGLPYAVCCHFAGDVVVQSLAPRLLG